MKDSVDFQENENTYLASPSIGVESRYEDGLIVRRIAARLISEFSNKPVAENDISYFPDGAPNLEGALAECGVEFSRVEVPSIVSEQLPACALTSTGEFALLLELKGETLFVFNPYNPDKLETISVSDFNRLYSGELIAIDVIPDFLAAAEDDSKLTIFSLLRPYLKLAGPFSAAGAVVNVLGLTTAIFAMQVYDRVLPHEAASTLWVLTAGVIVAIVLEFIMKTARNTLAENCNQKIEKALSMKLIKKSLGMEFGKRGLPPEVLSASFRDMSNLREIYSSSTLILLIDLPFVLLFWFAIGWVSQTMLLPLVIGSALILLPSVIASFKTARLLSKQTELATSLANLQQKVAYHRDLISIHGSKPGILSAWNTESDRAMRLMSKIKNLNARTRNLSLAFQQMTYIFVIFTGVFIAFTGEISMGGLIAIGILTNKATSPIVQLASLIAKWQSLRISLDQVAKTLDVKQRQTRFATPYRYAPKNGRIEAVQISYAHIQGETPNVNVPSLSIPKGQVIAIVGANGAGKSTLLKMLSGHLSVDTGIVTLEGTPVDAIEPDKLADTFGFLPQSVAQEGRTIREAIGDGTMVRSEGELWSALEFAGLKEVVSKHPLGLDAPLGYSSGFSEGHMQCMNWARLRLSDPDVLFLDEPTSALDLTAEARLISKLETWLAGKTVLFTTHRMPLLKLSSRMLVLESGKIAMDGPTETVIQTIANNRVK